MKKCFSLFLALVMVLRVGVMGAGAADAADCFDLRLGVSGYAVLVPAGYAHGELSAEDIVEAQLGYYASEQSSMDFDLYQFSKEGEPAALQPTLCAVTMALSATVARARRRPSSRPLNCAPESA